jgi:hypothetical protein
MLSGIATYCEWPWRAGTDSGENNIVIFRVRLLLKAFSVAFLAHENAFFFAKVGRMRMRPDGMVGGREKAQVHGELRWSAAAIADHSSESIGSTEPGRIIGLGSFHWSSVSA